MTIRVDPSRATPPSRQIVEAILDEIARGHFSAGARLPSVRGLAAEALVNPNTVGKAYRELELLGVSEGRNGAGVFVTAAGPALAREARRETTLDDVRSAVAAALATGHGTARVRAEVERLLAAEDEQAATKRRHAS